MNSKKLLIWLVIVVMAVFAAACGGNTEPAEESSGGDELQVAQELIVLTGSDASTFDPHFCTDSATEIFNKNMYNNLVRFNSEMELVPDLAESWSVSEDNLTWTFKLRQGVKFHDGTPFNAESVKVSFERVLNPDTGSPRRSVMEIIDKVEVVDESTVNITTKTPCGSLLQQLAHPVAAIISPTALDTYGEEYSSHPVGTGPFKFVEWKIGEELVLERNEDYFDNPPQVAKVYFRVVPEDATRSLLLESGSADIAMRLPVTEVERLEGNAEISISESDTVMTMYVALNNNKGALKDARVRQALNYAVDKSVIVNDILGGLATVADAPISPYTWGYASIGTYPYDVEKAKQLLDEAGYANGLELELWTPVGRYLMDTQVSENLQAQWAEAGINVKIRQWEFQALMSEVKKGEFDMVLLGWSPSTGDADQGLYPVFHSSQWPPASNRAHYSNATVDKLLEDAKLEVDSEKRAELYKQAQQIITDEAVWTFLYYPKQALAFRSNISGIEVLPTEHILLEDVVKN
ncbi:MAG: glutathione ABC transporter substrate-binding protein [Bacillota bacterium]|nr:glutathione ABC transporter substrate-binding protein [Clostridia bacterium]